MDNRIEQLRTRIEKIMMHLAPESSPQNRRFYLAGVIDTMADLGAISDEERGTLYAEYAV